MTTFLLYGISVITTITSFLSLGFLTNFWVSAYGDDSIFYPLFTASYFLSLIAGLDLSWIHGLKIFFSFLVRSKNKKVDPDTIHRLLQQTVILCGLTSSSVPLLKISIQFITETPVIVIMLITTQGFLAGRNFATCYQLKLPNSRLTSHSLFFTSSLSMLFATTTIHSSLFTLSSHAITSLWVGYLGMAGVLCLILLEKSLELKTLVIIFLAMISPILFNEQIKQPSSAPKLRQIAAPDATLIHSEQTKFHKLVLTEERGENPDFPGLPQHVLYVDGIVKFSSTTEQPRHACLVNVPLLAADFSGKIVRRALVLGGGEGLIARNILSLPRIEQITQVERDAQLIRLSQSEQKIRMYNLDSLRNPKVNLVNDDPFQWLPKTVLDFDLIVVDLPLPTHQGDTRYYSAEFYRRILQHLEPHGFVVIALGALAHSAENQPVATGANSQAFSTLKALGVSPHLYFNKKNRETFLLVSHNAEFNADTFFKRSGMNSEKESPHYCRYLKPENVFPSKVTTLNNLFIERHEFINHSNAPGWRVPRFHQHYAVFLPE